MRTFKIGTRRKDPKIKSGAFDEFYQSLDHDSGIRGKQFEKFVRWFMKTDPK